MSDRVADSARKREAREEPAHGDVPRGFQILVAPITINAHNTAEELCARDWTVGLWERIAFGYQSILSRRTANLEAANRAMDKQAIPSRIENNVASGNQPEGSRTDEEEVIGTNPWKHAATADAQANRSGIADGLPYLSSDTRRGGGTAIPQFIFGSTGDDLSDGVHQGLNSTA
jgi:hypothetical protein